MTPRINTFYRFTAAHGFNDFFVSRRETRVDAAIIARITPGRPTLAANLLADISR